MQVTLLGPVAAQVDGRSLPLGGRKQRCVFALLALNVNRTVSLDRLVYEIWRDEPPARATLALQAYVSRLRRVLAAATDDRPGRIVTRRPGWVLELPPQQIDAVRFDLLIADGRKLVAAGRPEEGATLLRGAVNLWTGDPLGDLDDGAFAVADLARLRERRLDAVEDLLDGDLARGADSAVIAAAEPFVDRHPYRERAWSALIIALYRSGRQAEALARTRELRETLAEGLGLDPSPAVRRLESMILNQDPALDAVAISSTLRPAAERIEATDRSAPPAPGALVGRHAELAAIVSAVDAANHGTGGLLIVEGPAGIGKSTILRSLEGSMRAIDGLVLRGAGGGAGMTPALWAWIAIVRQLREAMPDLARDEAAVTDALALLDPAMGDPLPPAQADPSLARTRLYRAVIDLLAAARAVRSIAVVIDDAHWLDHDSLDLLALAVDELVPRGLLIAVALRPDESSEIRHAVAALGTRLPVAPRRVTLTGLAEADVADIVNRLTGPDHDSSTVAAIAARTGGNPLFVVELVQLLMSERRLDSAGVYAFLPAGVRDVLRRRLDRLPEPTLAVLTVLALLGRGAPVTLLADVTGLDSDAALEAGEAAMLAGLLIDDPASGGFALSHDLVRQTLLDPLSTARTVRLHARVGDALRAGTGPHPAERVVEIAHHLTQAAPLLGAAAVPYLLAAADDALTRLASRSAEQYLNTAEEIVSTLPPSADRVVREAEIRSRRMTGRLIVPGEAAPQPLVGPGAVAPIDPEAPAAWWSAVLLLIACGDNTEAAAAGVAAGQGELPPGAAATVQFALGLAYFELGRFEEADACLARSEALVAATPGQAARGVFSFAGIVTVLRGCIAAVCGHHEAARRFVDLARAAPEQTIVQTVTIAFWATWCAVQEGDHARVGALASACIDQASDLGDSFYSTACRLFRGWAAAMAGDAGGLAMADDAYAEYTSRFTGLRHQNTVQLALRAEAYAHHGHLDRARELVRESRELATLTGEATLGVRLAAFADALVPTSSEVGTSERSAHLSAHRHPIGDERHDYCPAGEDQRGGGRAQQTGVTLAEIGQGLAGRGG